MQTQIKDIVEIHDIIETVKRSLMFQNSANIILKNLKEFVQLYGDDDVYFIRKRSGFVLLCNKKDTRVVYHIRSNGIDKTDITKKVSKKNFNNVDTTFTELNYDKSIDHSLPYCVKISDCHEVVEDGCRNHSKTTTDIYFLDTRAKKPIYNGRSKTSEETFEDEDLRNNCTYFGDSNLHILEDSNFQVTSPYNRVDVGQSYDEIFTYNINGKELKRINLKTYSV